LARQSATVFGVISPRPMPLIRVPDAFDAPGWVSDLKHDGFRALAHITGHRCEFVSRRRHVYRQFPTLADELAHCIRANSAILDGEIVCLGEDGRSLFRPLLYRRDWPHYIAFDLLAIDGDDLTRQPLLERKRRLRRIMPRIPSRVLYHDHIERRGRDLFTTVCRSDLEGMVAKWGAGRYHTDGRTTSWLKIKNPDYTQIAGRHELFEHRRDKPQHRSRSRVLRPVLSYEVSGG
jgi:bifunctional non-homologous end joining protein LigD